jgi:hypothetical protein
MKKGGLVFSPPTASRPSYAGTGEDVVTRIGDTLDSLPNGDQ